MLKDAESYSEGAWQKAVADLFLLIFPQYVAVLHGVQVKERYSKRIQVDGPLHRPHARRRQRLCGTSSRSRSLSSGDSCRRVGVSRQPCSCPRTVRLDHAGGEVPLLPEQVRQGRREGLSRRSMRRFSPLALRSRSPTPRPSSSPGATTTCRRRRSLTSSSPDGSTRMSWTSSPTTTCCIG